MENFAPRKSRGNSSIVWSLGIERSTRQRLLYLLIIAEKCLVLHNARQPVVTTRTGDGYINIISSESLLAFENVMEPPSRCRCVTARMRAETPSWGNENEKRANREPAFSMFRHAHCSPVIKSRFTLCAKREIRWSISCSRLFWPFYPIKILPRID